MCRVAMGDKNKLCEHLQVFQIRQGLQVSSMLENLTCVVLDTEVPLSQTYNQNII